MPFLERRHHFVGVTGGDAFYQLAAFFVSGPDGDGAVGARFNGLVALVQTQLGFAGGFVRTVAMETLGGYERENVASEVDLVGCGQRGSRRTKKVQSESSRQNEPRRTPDQPSNRGRARRAELVDGSEIVSRSHQRYRVAASRARGHRPF